MLNFSFDVTLLARELKTCRMTIDRFVNIIEDITNNSYTLQSLLKNLSSFSICMDE